MNKTEFLDALRHALGKLPSYEVEQSIAFYAEMIDDRIEDGMSEQEAVAALGSVHAIAAQIVAETPPIPRPSRSEHRQPHAQHRAACHPLPHLG